MAKPTLANELVLSFEKPGGRPVFIEESVDAEAWTLISCFWSGDDELAVVGHERMRVWRGVGPAKGQFCREVFGQVREGILGDGGLCFKLSENWRAEKAVHRGGWS